MSYQVIKSPKIIIILSILFLSLFDIFRLAFVEKTCVSDDEKKGAEEEEEEVGRMRERARERERKSARNYHKLNAIK